MSKKSSKQNALANMERPAGIPAHYIFDPTGNRWRARTATEAELFLPATS